MESFNELLTRIEKSRETTTYATCPIHNLAYDPEHWSCCERCWEKLCVEERLQKALRRRIDIATADLARWTATNSECPYTTRTDCKIEYHQIIGMIDALEAIGGPTIGLRSAAQRALNAAKPNCFDETQVLGS